MSVSLSGSPRPVDWRWQQAQYMRSISLMTIDSCFASDYLNSDPYVRLAHELIRLLEKDELRLIDSVRRKQVRKELEYAVLAYGLQSKNKVMNWVFKALMLSQAPVQIKTALLGRDELYCDIHSALFFDVGHRLDDVPCIWKQVIDTDSQDGLDGHSAPYILLECAYLACWQRFLILLAAISRCLPEHLQAVWAASFPNRWRYCPPSTAMDRARQVIRERMQTETGRTIDDLRQLYRSIPIIDDGMGAAAPGKPRSPQGDGHLGTYCEIVDARAGQHRQLPAALLIK